MGQVFTSIIASLSYDDFGDFRRFYIEYSNELLKNYEGVKLN